MTGPLVAESLPVALAGAAGRARLLGGFLRPLLPVLGAVLVISWLIALAWWALLPTARTLEVVIPDGTAARIARGEAVSAVPDELFLRRGDTLVLRNEDRQVHRIGLVWAPPGESTRAPVTAEFFAHDGLVCSFHPGGAIGVSPLSRPGVEKTLIPTLFMWAPLSIAIMVAAGIAGRLKLD